MEKEKDSNQIQETETNCMLCGNYIASYKKTPAGYKRTSAGFCLHSGLPPSSVCPSFSRKDTNYTVQNVLMKLDWLCGSLKETLVFLNETKEND